MTSNSYIFRVSDVIVHNCRSKGDHNDSDWMHLIVKINDQIQQPTGLFNIGDNIHAGDPLPGPWEVGPYLISDQDKVVVALSVENLSHTDSAEQSGEAIKVGTLIVGGLAGVAASLTKSAADQIIGGVFATAYATVGEILGWIVGKSDPNCNGEVLSDSFQFDPGELARRAPFTVTNEYTSRSPSECGNPPDTSLTFQTLPVGPPPRVTHEFLAGVNADHTIQVFQFTPGGGWTTGRIGWASVAGPLTSWVAGGTWHLGGLGTDGNVYVLWQSPGHDWQGANITSAVKSPADTRAPLTSWVVGESEFLAGVNADHTIQVFQFTPGGGWTTGRIGWASVAGPLTSWVAGGTWHLGGLGTDGNVYVLWQSPGHDWQAVNISAITGSRVKPPMTAWLVNDVEHLAGLDAAGQPVVFWWSPAHDWQATKTTIATGQPIGDGLQSWIIPI
jgi:hypothetical protein